MAYEWLKSLHPIYEQRKVEWEKNERRLRGGEDILEELRAFDWELPYQPGMRTDRTTEHALQEILEQQLRTGQMGQSGGMPFLHYRRRQEQALYVNFPEALMALLTGHLFRKRPKSDHGLDFGTLGEVSRQRTSEPSDAELVFYNADGVGNDGSQWDAFWANVVRWSGATGHRWCMVEATTQGSSNRSTISVLRPYMVHLSPLDVPNWDYVDGKLAWALRRLAPLPASLVNGTLERSKTGPLCLYVRKGVTSLGDEFAGGGWWTFNEDGTEVSGDGMRGTWDKTNGEIPMWPHYYERDDLKMSRPGTSEMGNAAVAYMNLDSAATFDAWDAAKSIVWLLGVEPANFDIAVQKMREGAIMIPVPPSSGGPDSDKPLIVPTVADSAMGAVPADIFMKRLTAIRDTVREVGGMEATSTPASSGKSKLVGFGESRAPRLGLLASEVETSQNIAIRFLELRFGNAKPTGSVAWTRDFDLAPVLDTVQAFFDIEGLSGLSSPTAGVRNMMAAVRESGTITDDKELATVEAEYKASAQAGLDQRAKAAALMGNTVTGAAGAGTVGPDGQLLPPDPGNPEPGNLQPNPTLKLPRTPIYRPVVPVEGE